MEKSRRETLKLTNGESQSEAMRFTTWNEPSNVHSNNETRPEHIDADNIITKY